MTGAANERDLSIWRRGVSAASAKRSTDCSVAVTLPAIRRGASRRRRASYPAQPGHNPEDGAGHK